MEKYISDLDTSRFGFKVAKVNVFDDTPLKIVKGLEKFGAKLIISRVFTSDIKLINQMEDAGFRLKDVQVTYNFNIAGKILPLITDDSYLYRSFESKDTDSVVRIASESFKDYGHYAKNEKIDKAKTNEIYADWAHRCCTSKDFSDHIIVAEIDKKVVGFLSFKIFTEERSQYAFAALGAVDKNHRKGGVFRNINLAGLHWAQKTGIQRVETNVLVTNFPVNTTYISLGFHTIRTESTFHCWLGE